MKSTGIAYLLWFIGGCGCLGLHRFYLGKIPTGILWLVTGGLGCLGGIYDFFTLSQQVRQVNNFIAEIQYNKHTPEQYEPRKAQNLGSTEHIILQLAKQNNGIVTPSEVALETELSLEKAKKELDQLVNTGFAELRVRQNGTIVYTFADFLSDDVDLA